MKALATACALSIASGAIFGLAFPPTGWALLAWIALAPLFVAVRRGGLVQALFVTWLWCLSASYAIGDWFPRLVSGYFGQSMAVTVALYFGVFTLMAGPYYMGFAAAYRALARHYRLALPLLAGAAWTAAEFGRGRLFTGTPLFIGNPWGLIGYSQTDLLPVVQIAAVTGMYGVSFALGCTNAGAAELWCALRSRESLRRVLPGVALALVPAAVFVVYGWLTLRAADEVDLGGPPTTVAIVQGNLSIGTHWQSDFYGRNLDVYMRLTHEADREGEPELVFWPESAMTFFLESEPLYQQSIGRLLAHDGVQLVAGGPRQLGAGASRYSNSVWLIDADGSLRGRYDKQYLIPFAEYFPLGVDILKREFGRVREFEVGEAAAPLETRAGPAGVVICNEAMFPEVVGRRVADGAVYLVNPSNDSWISDEKYTEQNFDIALMRAIEQRRFLVRASTAGPSAVVDPWGRVQVRTEPLTQGVILGTLRPSEEVSVYGRVGDLFASLCLLAVVVALVRPRLKRPPTP